jgi:hypothetical protein
MYDADHEGNVNNKYATTLLGKPTRVLVESELVREVLDKERERNEERRRRLWAEALSGSSLWISRLARLSVSVGDKMTLLFTPNLK